MSLYRVIAPLFLARFQHDTGVTFRAWSPRHHGGVEDDSHPALTVSYMEALSHVMYAIEDSEHFVDLVVDYHSPVRVEERGDRVFFVTLRDSLFSPVFFAEADAEVYLKYVRESLVEWREGLKIGSATHSLLAVTSAPGSHVRS